MIYLIAVYRVLIVPGEEVVLLSQVIAHHCNIGYESYSNMHLTKFNGENITNIRQLKDRIEELKLRIFSDNTSEKDQYLVFEMSNGRIVVIDAKAAFEAQDQVKLVH